MLFSLGVFSHNTIYFEYLWDDQLVIHIHHVIVRQHKSSTESVSFEHLRICHRKGRKALKFLGTTHLPSAATLPDLASPHFTFGWKSFIPNLNSLSQRYCAGKASSKNILRLISLVMVSLDWLEWEFVKLVWVLVFVLLLVLALVFFFSWR
jgi:hypothetical protein